MYMKSLVSLAVLGAMSAVATAGDLVVFDKPNESYTVDGLNKYGATIKASDITITNTTYNGIDAYGVFDLNAANDISIQGDTNGIFTPTDHENSSITIKTPKKLTITGPWAIHAEGKGTITIDAGDLVLRGSNFSLYFQPSAGLPETGSFLRPKSTSPACVRTGASKGPVKRSSPESVGSSQRRLIFVSIQAACTKRSSTPSESKVFIQTGSVRIQASQTSRSAPSCLTVSSNWRLCDSLCERSHFGPPSSSLRTGSGIV